MDKLESIKERKRTGITEYMHDGEKAEIFREDIAYLLQRLKRYEEGLKLAITHISGEGKTFSEREKVPVLFQLKEALKE